MDPLAPFTPWLAYINDGTAYSDYHASGGFLSHHLARISMAAAYWDARHIDEGVDFLKQRAQPHA